MKTPGSSETNALFPSGDWEGFYLYSFGQHCSRHMMYFSLEFQNDEVHGTGGDDIGAFQWAGHYDTDKMECHMIKHYATHRVIYDGKVDENGIWGTWTIPPFGKGGFHIWPKKAGEAFEEAAIEIKESELVQGNPGTPGDGDDFSMNGLR
jgi:hypothetical protein